MTATVTGLATYLPAPLELPEGVRYEPAADLDALAAFLGAAPGPVILWSDGIEGDDLHSLAAVVRDLTVEVIEVHPRSSDGLAANPLSGACRGVISGFGPNGILRALEALFGGYEPEAQ